MKNKKLLISFYIITYLTSLTAQFVYPALKSPSRYSFTIFQDRQVTYSTYSIMETHRDYKDCITICYNNFDRCKSIDTQRVTNTTIICRFFNDESPNTQFSMGYLFISTKPPNCSLSCSSILNPCGKCKCSPSCSARNTRQYICNCTTAAGDAKSCQEHYNNGFTQSGVYQIIPNGFRFETLCEMDKVEHNNPKINTEMCMEQPSEFSYALSISYCVVTCALKSDINIVIFNTPCFCAKFKNIGHSCYNCFNPDYCEIEDSSTSCTLKEVNSNRDLNFNNQVDVGLNINSCVTFCNNYHNTYSTYNGYVASGIALTKNDCLCLYGFTGKTTSAYYGCLYFAKPPMTIVPILKDEQLVQKGNLIATLSVLEKTFSISFMLKPRSNNGYSVIHFTIDGNSGLYGERIPGIWFDPSLKLYISFALNGNPDSTFYTESRLSLNVWSSVHLSQTEIEGVYTFKVYLNNKIEIEKTNTKPQFFKNVLVYLSDPWHTAFDGYIKDLKIVNGYVDFVDDVSEFEIEKEKLIALLSYLDKAYSVSFKLKPRSYSAGWKSVIHLTIETNSEKYGDRSPAIFFDLGGSGKLYVTSAVNGYNNYAFYSQPLPLNVWSSIQICQMRLNATYIFSVYLNKTLIHRIENTNPQPFENVKVYAADPWYDAQDGSIKDLKIISGNKGIWIPMMTRFSSWESTFWGKSYEEYENGFGLMNQQWIGLKNLNQITNTFFTDMRIDYSFNKDIAFSTLYYNVTVGSSEAKYIFRYDKYDPRGSGDPDRLNINGIVFSDCNKWWTTSASCNANIFPTSSNYISFGSARELLSIQFFLCTNTEK